LTAFATMVCAQEDRDVIVLVPNGYARPVPGLPDEVETFQALTFFKQKDGRAVNHYGISMRVAEGYVLIPTLSTLYIRNTLSVLRSDGKGNTTIYIVQDTTTFDIDKLIKMRGTAKPSETPK